MFVPIAEALKSAGKTINIRGWAYRVREQKGAVFIVLRDSTGLIQCIFKDSAEATKVTIESSLEIEGVVKEDPRAPGGAEIAGSSLKIVGLAERFPIGKDQSEEFLRDVRHLWVRSQKLANIFKIRSSVFQAIREFYTSRGFYEIQSPIFTTNACEGATTLFEVKYGKPEKVYLAQSWQLHAEALIYSLEKIFTIAPSFRAEKSRTIRHLSEYWHHEAEVAWMDFEGMLKLEEELVVFVTKYVLEKNEQELKALGKDLEELRGLKTPFQRLTYEQMLKEMGKKWGDDITDAEERELVKKLGNKPIFLTHFPREMKAFYMKPAEKGKTVLAADLLIPGVGEVIGGSQRIDKLEELTEAMEKFGLNKKDYEWYIDLQKYGSVPHSGFGLGVERLLMWLTGTAHIMDTIPFPRTMDRIKP